LNISMSNAWHILKQKGKSNVKKKKACKYRIYFLFYIRRSFFIQCLFVQSSAVHTHTYTLLHIENAN
jgi:hypothetical protein